MKKVKKSIKGMTLIEVVVSLLIISTASLIMVQGFTTANRMLYEANQYNETTNDVRSRLVANESGKVESSSTVKVTTEGTDGTSITIKDVPIKGNFYAAQSKTFSDNQLRTFSSSITLKTIAPEEPSENVGSDLYSSYCAMMEDIQDYLKQNVPSYYSDQTTLKSDEVKKALGKYIRQEKFGTTNEQLNTLGLSDSINLKDKLGKMYVAQYFRGNSKFPSITRNTAIAMASDPGSGNKNIFKKYDDENAVYPATDGSNYCYPTLLPVFSDEITLNDLFEKGMYKDKIFIILHNHPNVQIPNDSVAVYNNKKKSVLDEWFVYYRTFSVSNLTNLSGYSAFYDEGTNFPKILGNKTNWWKFTVKK